MNILSQLNSPVIYLICAVIVTFVALLCVVFAVRAYRAGKAIGMDVTKMRRTIVASATFAVLPSVGILLGVIALSGSLGTPWPWLRLSVIGALHYETQVAQAAAEAVGVGGLSAANMTPEAFSTIGREAVHHHRPHPVHVPEHVSCGLKGAEAHPLPVEAVRGTPSPAVEQDVPGNGEGHQAISERAGYKTKQPDEHPLHPGCSVRGAAPLLMFPISQPAAR